VKQDIIPIQQEAPIAHHALLEHTTQILDHLPAQTVLLEPMPLLLDHLPAQTVLLVLDHSKVA
jgi:hypothetical protein